MLEIVLDYESSFTYSESEIPRIADFYAGPGGDVVEEVEFKSKAKFQKRLMVWLAISPRGISKPIFQRRMATMNSVFYRKKYN